MDLPLLIEALGDGAAYPHPAGHVEVCHTHISVVFLAGAYAYKIKKPVNLGFLDFTTLAQRRHFCDEEVRLNRRLAADVYQGVVPVTRAGDRILCAGHGALFSLAGVGVTTTCVGDRLTPWAVDVRDGEVWTA